jgi:hypothetical protein
VTITDNLLNLLRRNHFLAKIRAVKRVATVSIIAARLSKIFVLIAILSAADFASSFAQPEPESSTSYGVPSIDALKLCLAGANSAACLDRIFRDVLKTQTTKSALQLIQRFELEDSELRRDCHPIVHAVGRETFRIKGNIHDSFSACDQTCHSGCYHGSVERFLRGEEIYSQADRHPSQAELKQKAAAACDSGVPVRLRFQCLHGLGHALMFFSRYKLAPSLEACDALAEEWGRHSCYGGVFMENVFNSTPELRDVSPTDYHYPCNRIDTKYRAECYVMQTSRMTEMGLSISRLFEECQKSGEYELPCTVSIGRDLSNDVRMGQTRATAQKCESVTAERRLACLRGVIYALIDNTWDGRYALPFCVAFGEESDRQSCIKESLGYLRTTFQKSSEEITDDCSQYLGQPNRCTELAPG